MIRHKAIVVAWSWRVAWLAMPGLAEATDAFSFNLAPGKFDEHCLKIDAGTTIRYRFEATAAVDFNIHHHRGSEVFYPVKRERIARAKDEFRADVGDDYCLMWTNPGEGAVRVTGEVAR